MGCPQEIPFLGMDTQLGKDSQKPATVNGPGHSQPVRQQVMQDRLFLRDHEVGNGVSEAERGRLLNHSHPRHCFGQKGVGQKKGMRSIA